jgi:hypothetical protein
MISTWYDLASLFYFNDEYEGGELYFPVQHGIEFQPKAGAAYFFPGDRHYATRGKASKIWT